MSSPLESLYQEEIYHITTPVLFVLSEPWETLAEADRTTLTKMVAALRLNMAAISMVTRKEFTLASLAPFEPRRVIALGARLAPAVAPYQHTTIDGVSVITGDALHQLDDAKKKNLWLALRQMFGI